MVGCRATRRDDECASVASAAFQPGSPSVRRMETRAIGSLTVSVVGIGCNNFGRRIDEAASRAVVEAALDEGITLFDTADTYGEGQSEEFLSRALASRRDDVVI